MDKVAAVIDALVSCGRVAKGVQECRRQISHLMLRLLAFELPLRILIDSCHSNFDKSDIQCLKNLEHLAEEAQQLFNLYTDRHWMFRVNKRYDAYSMILFNFFKIA